MDFYPGSLKDEEKRDIIRGYDDMILLQQSSTDNFLQARNAYWAQGERDIMFLDSRKVDDCRGKAYC